MFYKKIILTFILIFFCGAPYCFGNKDHHFDFSKTYTVSNEANNFTIEIREILRDTSQLRYESTSNTSFPDLLRKKNLKVANYIGIAWYKSSDFNTLFRKGTKELVRDVQIAMMQLKYKIRKDSELFLAIKCITRIGEFKTTKRKSNKKIKPWTWNRHHYAIEKLADKVIEKKPVFY
jgi:hypothetical protein